MKKFALVLAASLPAMVLGASAQAAVLDDFNRADAGTLGANWTQQAGTSGISGNQATGSNLSLATFNGGSGNYISFDITNVGASIQYIAAVFGFGAANNMFIKVQNNGGSQGFNRLGFYTDNNNSTGGLFSNLSSAFLTGLVEASYVGSTATIVITPTGGPAQTYSHDYGVAPSGTSIGLGFFGAALADNFADSSSSAPGVPEPATWAMMLLGFAAVGASMRRKQAGKVRFAF